MDALVVWYVFLTTIPGSLLTYARPIGPFTYEQCHRMGEVVRDMKWSEIASIECRKAVRFEVCELPDMPHTNCCCPIFERGKGDRLL
jgi:hypothetical protein